MTIPVKPTKPVAPDTPVRGEDHHRQKELSLPRRYRIGLREGRVE